jgi:hypothetical protein
MLSCTSPCDGIWIGFTWYISSKTWISSEGVHEVNFTDAVSLTSHIRDDDHLRVFQIQVCHKNFIQSE